MLKCDYVYLFLPRAVYYACTLRALLLVTIALMFWLKAQGTKRKILRQLRARRHWLYDVLVHTCFPLIH